MARLPAVAAIVLLAWVPRGWTADRDTSPAGASGGVRFTFVGPSARSVHLAGSFNGWSMSSDPMTGPDGAGRWTLVKAIPEGRHQYKFVVNGGEAWVQDPANPRSADDGTGTGGRNSVVVVASDGRVEALPARVTIRGRVRDAAGRPVQGALVAIVPPDAHRAAARTRSGEDGGSSAEVPSGEYSITVTTVEHAAACVAPRAWEADASIDLHLGGAGLSVSGLAADDAGTPLPRVAVTLGRQDDGCLFYAETDARGRYSATVPAGSEYWVAVQSDAHVAALRPATGAGRRALDLVATRRRRAPPDVVGWIRGHAIPLRTVEAGQGVEDMRALRGLIGEARVVALGEATHGSREFFQLKHRLLEFLVETMGFSVFALEANGPETLALDEYVREGRGDPKEALRATYWTWNTEEVLGLVEWVRRWNADPAHPTKVRFYGFDMRSAASERVQEYLQRVDAEGAAAAAKMLGPLRGASDLGLSAQPRHAREALSAGLQALIERFDARRVEYMERSSEREWTLFRHQVVIAQQAVAYATGGDLAGVRDRAMAENVEWILAREPGAKVVAWAHNMHVSEVYRPSNPPMGWHLRRALGQAYLALGFAFHQGSFRALDLTPWTQGSRNPVREHSVGPAPEENVEAALRQAGAPLLALDLRDRPGVVVPRWFSLPHPMRETGAAYFGEAALSGPVVLTEAYDALLFVERTTPSVPLER